MFISGRVVPFLIIFRAPVRGDLFSRQHSLTILKFPIRTNTVAFGRFHRARLRRCQTEPAELTQIEQSAGKILQLDLMSINIESQCSVNSSLNPGLLLVNNIEESLLVKVTAGKEPPKTSGRKRLKKFLTVLKYLPT